MILATPGLAIPQLDGPKLLTVLPEIVNKPYVKPLVAR
jgi:hypothetical protein